MARPRPVIDESAGTLTHNATFPVHATQQHCDPAESQVALPAYHTTLHGDKEEGADESAGSFISYADELHRWQMCVGKHNLTLVEPTEVCYKILGIYRHEGFVYPEIPALEFDIALVKLDGEVVANDVIDFACLPPDNQVLPESYRCHATGWGDETGNSTAPKAAEGLNQVALPVIPYEVCKTPLYWWFQIKESMICAGYVYPDELKSVCQGDSGGPLVCPSTTDSSTWEVHGITSFGPIGCIMDKKPTSGCGSAKELTERNGIFTSMRYPSTYSNDADCVWNIVAPADEVIHLHFNNFVIEESTLCSNDRIVISDELGSVGDKGLQNMDPLYVRMSDFASLRENRAVRMPYGLHTEDAMRKIR
ncbi:unnamed protein product [Ranitomeya imitator]|uniref:Uncharacterized protein n=1 Tax=Ranitomeya imitator TaxID=111125 RepID=A0ABN9LT58_9NEOB|nr:unnamed protein product [Ranitomeya imitator]